MRWQMAISAWGFIPWVLNIYLIHLWVLKSQRNGFRLRFTATSDVNNVKIILYLYVYVYNAKYMKHVWYICIFIYFLSLFYMYNMSQSLHIVKWIISILYGVIIVEPDLYKNIAVQMKGTCKIKPKIANSRNFF